MKPAEAETQWPVEDVEIPRIQLLSSYKRSYYSSYREKELPLIKFHEFQKQKKRLKLKI